MKKWWYHINNRGLLAKMIWLHLAVFCYAALCAQKPNIIIILTDDMGFGDLSCFNSNATYKTPNIDAMAAEGLRITNYYSASPVCSPSRVGLTTGMAPAKWNITNYLSHKEHNAISEQKDFLDTSATTIAKLFKTNGYSTAHFGKWHMGGGRDVTNAPPIKEYGFDEWCSTWESPGPDPLLTDSAWVWSKTDSIKRWNRSAYFVDKTIAFLKQNMHAGKNGKSKPCFINLWPDDVHTPWVPGDDYAPNEGSSEKNFVRVLNEYDLQIGRLVRFLKQSGLHKNTLLLFTSDNGPAPNFRSDRSAGMRGAKVSLYEGGIRMPFIAWWPGSIKANSVDTSSVLMAVDILSTLSGVTGIKNKVATDGEDRSNVLLGQPSGRQKDIYWEYGRNERSFNYPKIKGGRSPQLAVRSGAWKLLMNADGSNVELYNLLNDKNEENNLAAAETAIAKQLEKKLAAWWSGLPKWN